jgi:hypothetical protein
MSEVLLTEPEVFTIGRAVLILLFARILEYARMASDDYPTQACMHHTSAPTQRPRIITSGEYLHDRGYHGLRKRFVTHRRSDHNARTCSYMIHNID